MTVLRDPAFELTKTVVETPEGVELTFTVAPAADRFVAFFIDAVLLIVAVLVIFWITSIAAAFAGFVGLAGFVKAVAYIGIFAITNFYFFWFEARWQGRTPGKKRIDIRVIDRHGGPLTLGALFARNLTRQVEVVLPIVVMIDPSALAPGAGPSLRFVAVAWILVLGFLPLFNRGRLRIGDWIAGTIVVTAPKQELLADLGGRTDAKARDVAAVTPPQFTFTAKQLEHYGIYELQVLEEVLRSPNSDRKALRAVARTIGKKIGWNEPIPARPRRFLEDFYAAQRAALERHLLFGRRREDKHDDTRD